MGTWTSKPLGCEVEKGTLPDNAWAVDVRTKKGDSINIDEYSTPNTPTPPLCAVGSGVFVRSYQWGPQCAPYTYYRLMWTD